MADPQVFSVKIAVSEGDIDRQGHVNNVAFVRYVQDAAVGHWRTAAPPEMRDAFTWVVRRHEVEYLSPGLPGDELVARTWVGKPSGASWERFTEVVRAADGRVLVRARTVWVLLDAATGRPRRVDPRIVTSLAGGGADGGP
jgi:acyl-CoA thioester hydrolase